MAKISPEKKAGIKKGARLASYGVAGNIAGTVVGFQKGHQKAGAHIGTAVGVGVGSFIESKRKSVPSQQKSVGEKRFGRQVGTKTQGRVGKRNRTFNPKPQSNRGGADAATY